MKHKISLSLLSADFLHLQQEVELINDNESDWLHLDIMDGVFVPNISYGFPIMEAIRPILKKPMDVHLMVADPGKFIDMVSETGASVMTVHYEVSPHLHRTIAAIRKAGMTAGVALNPHTPISLLEDIIHDVDMVLLMSVNPGFGGQHFIEHSVEKTARLKDMITSKGLHTLIEVDGGVNMETAGRLITAGADILVTGSFVFKSPIPQQTIKDLKAL